MPVKNDAARLLGTVAAFLAFAFASGLLFVFAWPLLVLVPVIWFLLTRNHRGTS